VSTTLTLHVPGNFPGDIPGDFLRTPSALHVPARTGSGALLRAGAVLYALWMIRSSSRKRTLIPVVLETTLETETPDGDVIAAWGNCSEFG